MLVFLSWSGERSKGIAQALERWFSQVIQAVEPWISTDIEKGLRWGPEITDRLEQSRVGIIVLTPENLESPWILFEAGALSKTKTAYVCTLLVDLTHADVEPPLSQFQHTTIEKTDVARLVRTINSAVASSGERALSEAVLTDVFETFWPQLESSLLAIASNKPSGSPPARPQSQILDEILTTVRNLERRQASSSRENILDVLRRNPRAMMASTDPWSDLALKLARPLSKEERHDLLNYITFLMNRRDVTEPTLPEPPPKIESSDE